MSPAINDLFTAMTGMYYLGEGRERFKQHIENSAHSWERDSQLPLVLEPVTFDDLLRFPCDMLRQTICKKCSVLLHLLEVIDTINREVKSPEVA